jgi:mannose-6-phosphate isomerase-like protein (cupin superfamily)
VRAETDGSKPAHDAYFPPVGGFRFGLFTVPPATDVMMDDLDIGTAVAAIEAGLPGLAAHMEPDHPGMHTTASIDYEFVVSGSIVLELDDWTEVELHPGDTVIQNGTRHAWRNKGSEPCQMVVVLVGAPHSDVVTPGGPRWAVCAHSGARASTSCTRRRP